MPSCTPLNRTLVKIRLSNDFCIVWLNYCTGKENEQSRSTLRWSFCSVLCLNGRHLIALPAKLGRTAFSHLSAEISLMFLLLVSIFTLLAAPIMLYLTSTTNQSVQRRRACPKTKPSRPDISVRACCCCPLQSGSCRWKQKRSDNSS